MRTLLAATAVIVAITSAHAQEPVRSLPPQTTIDQASQDIVQKLKAAGELKRDTGAAVAKPSDGGQADAKPVVPAPVEAKPAEVKATEAKAPAAKPADAKAVGPADAKAVETRPADTKPVHAATEPKPEKKRVVRKRETHEQTARRLAARYGFQLDFD